MFSNVCDRVRLVALEPVWGGAGGGKSYIRRCVVPFIASVSYTELVLSAQPWPLLSAILFVWEAVNGLAACTGSCAQDYS